MTFHTELTLSYQGVIARELLRTVTTTTLMADFPVHFGPGGAGEDKGRSRPISRGMSQFRGDR